MDPLTQALALATEMYKAYNAQTDAVKQAQAQQWQTVFDDFAAFFAKLPLPIALPRIVVWIPPKS
jgi:hypothetical protein